MRRALIIIFALSLLSSCAAISKETRSKALYVPFPEVKDNIDKYKGSLFIWGGSIVKTELTNQGAIVEVVQKPVNKYGEIVDEDISGGRFLALYKGHLDPMIYRKQRDITVAGTLIGREERKIGETTLVYPVLEVVELYLWKEPTYYEPPYYYYPPYWYYPWGSPYIYPYPYPYPYNPPP